MANLQKISGPQKTAPNIGLCAPNIKAQAKFRKKS
jgi:hypothetical protein